MTWARWAVAAFLLPLACTSGDGRCGGDGCSAMPSGSWHVRGTSTTTSNASGTLERRNEPRATIGDADAGASLRANWPTEPNPGAGYASTASLDLYGPRLARDLESTDASIDAAHDGAVDASRDAPSTPSTDYSWHLHVRFDRNPPIGSSALQDLGATAEYCGSGSITFGNADACAGSDALVREPLSGTIHVVGEYPGNREINASIEYDLDVPPDPARAFAMQLHAKFDWRSEGECM